MVESSDPNRKKRMFQNAQQSGPPGPGWTPMSAAEFAAELARSHPQYVVKELIDHGAMGAVYLAEEPEASRRVAIKMLRPDAQDDETYLRRFDREIKILRGLHHPNIVRIFDDGVTPDGYRFFVMEWLEGRTLASKLEESERMRFDRVVHITTDICEGLEHAHGKNLVHRDLKAANIGFTSDGRAVILDFGVARDVTAETSSASERQGIPGTRGHIAPELFERKPATRASDVFSLGVIFLHLLAGKIPDGAYVMPSHYGLDSRLDAVVTKALSRNPEDRYQSAHEFAEAIKAAAIPAPTPRPVEPVPPPPRRDNPSPSPAPAKTKEKTDDAGSSTSTAPIPKDINDELSARRLQEHLDFLDSWRPSKPPKPWQSTPISEGEDWKVVHQWDAFPELPSREKVQRMLKLRRILNWAGGLLGFGLALIVAINGPTNSSGDWLITLVSIAVKIWIAFGLIGGGYVGSEWLFERLVVPLLLPKPSIWVGDGSPPSLLEHKDLIDSEFLGEGGSKTSQILDPQQLFWHPHQPHLFTSRDYCHLTGWRWSSEQNVDRVPQYSHVQISDDQILCSKGWIENMFFSDYTFLVKTQSPSWFIYDYRGDLKTRIRQCWFLQPIDVRSNPLRPDHYGEVLLHSYNDLSIFYVSNLPKLLYQEAWPRIQEFAKRTISLAKLQLFENESVKSFAWHPSGNYLALEISGRLHLLHWDFAEHVRYPDQGGEKYEAVAWSPDGTLLAVDRNLSKVWDMRTNEIRPTAPHERWDYRPAGSLDNQLKSCDGLRRFSSHHGGPNFPIKDWEEVTDIAWCPDDPDIFATVGGKDCPRDIRIWQRVK